jgi:pyrimidine-nucleoside phosphorylase
VFEPFRILDRLRAGEALTEGEIRAVVAGAASGSWTDAQLSAFLMGVAVRGLDVPSTGALTRAMLDSGERWELAERVPHLGDKHSTGGVGDKVSLVIGPLLAACDRPVIMLTGRGLGHTAGTADKLETIPGLSLELDRHRSLELLSHVGLAVGVPTRRIAPADRVLYALRDTTGTVRSIPLVVASILSKKLATGASGLALDVKTGSGAFFRSLEDSRALATRLVETAGALGLPASALITDMSQPLGRWVGHTAEVREALDCLAGEGPADLLEVSLRLAEEVADLVGRPIGRDRLEAALASGAARERFDRWAEMQGADTAWLADPRLPVAPEEAVLRAPRGGTLAAIDTEELGMTLATAGGGRTRPDDPIDPEVALRMEARLGDRVAEGDALARLHLRRPDAALVERAAGCFEITDTGVAPRLVHDRIPPAV